MAKRKVNGMLEILGITGRGYELKLVKPTVYIHPSDYSKKIRLMVRVIFKSNNGDFSNPFYIYLKSNNKIHASSEEIFDLSHKLIDRRYSEGIGMDLNKRVIFPLKISHPIELRFGNGNTIIIKVVPDIKKMSQTLKEQMIEDTKEILFEFMIDAIIENEGIETDLLWKQLLGLSRFAWKFQITLWNLAENMYQHTGADLLIKENQHEKESCSVINVTDRIHVFFVIPKDLIESVSQMVTIPGADTSHPMTRRDKDILLSTEKRKRHKRRIMEWVEEGARAFSWKYDFTATRSREIVVEHLPARLTSWSLFTSTTILFTLASIMLQILRITPTQEKYFWMIWPVLFCFSYFYTNLKRFSFFELGKKKNLKFLAILLRTSFLGFFVILLLLLPPKSLLQEVGLVDSIILAFVISIIGFLPCHIKNKKKSDSR